MYRDLFLNYLNSQISQGILNDSINYLLCNENASHARASLVLAWTEYCGGKVENALPLAYAAECIHTSSLIQDDLPCMDNAQMRRGKVCTHIKYGEDTAILVSDALLTMAYASVLRTSLPSNEKCKAIDFIANSTIGLFNGQYLDLNQNVINTFEDYLCCSKLKTANLFQLSAVLGVIAAQGNDTQLQEALVFGEIIGTAYQIKDDLKDQDGITKFLSMEKINSILQNMNTTLPHYNHIYLEKVRNQILC